MTTLFLLALAFVLGVIVGNKFLPSDFINSVWLWLAAAAAAIASYWEQMMGWFNGAG